MDELSVRALFERAASPEPPLGHLVGDSIRAGRRLRRRRRVLSTVAAVAGAGVIAAIVPAAGSSAGGRHQLDSELRRTPQATTAYVETGSGKVVPVHLATNTLGPPIAEPEAGPGDMQTAAAATPNGRTVYEIVGTGLTPIDTATDTARPTIVMQNVEQTGVLTTPNGKTAYLSTELGVYPISTATDALGKRINIPGGVSAMAITPNSRILYAASTGDGQRLTRTVTPIETATNTALAPIKLPVLPRNGRGYLSEIAITPNGRTAYILDGVQEGKPYFNVVIPVNLATDTALAPIPLEASGLASGIVIAPGGRTAYVLSSRAVTPIDTATNRAEPAISLPATAGYAYDIAMTPNGKSIYVLTPRGVIPIRTASRAVLPMIKVPMLANFTELAIIPDGRTMYVGASITRPSTYNGHKFGNVVGGGVVPISTATNTAGRFINLGGTPVSITFAR